jgi:hypothetical protein
MSMVVATSSFAQEGHPLTGAWSGDWGPAGGPRNHLTFVMKWSGKNVTGTINPGPDAIPITNIAVDWTNWTVRFEATAKDSSGSPVRISADGKFEDVGSYHRKIAGTWTQGAAKGDFKITRD